MTYLPEAPSPAPAPEPGPAPGSAPAPAAHRPRRASPSVAFAAGLAVMLVAILLVGSLRPSPAPLTRADIDEAIAGALASQTPPPPDSELVFAAVRPSVVVIETTGLGTTQAGDPQQGEGAGVVVTQAGAVLTALHVVDGAATVRLTFADGSTSLATVATSDAARDIAVLTPDTPPRTVVPAELGNPGSLRIGSRAFIVGNPFGLVDSLSVGVVSGLDRSIRDPETMRQYTGLIQVDAAVNPGNSGGPLVDAGGRVVGIVTSLINPTDQKVFIGIGLAVPIDVAGGAAGLPPY